MSCKDEEEKNDAAWSALREANASFQKAHRKLENRLKVAGASCAIGAIGALLGPAGLIAGGSACIGALLAADDAAVDYDYARIVSEIASDKYSRTLTDEFMCLSRCGPAETPPNS
ncbi:hypothetical protein [Enhygromyxa salina]|uniref:Uncharacterized protein n=1 Tax=Enhygromyxa salina TaxID=215803 RepID=A0A2S9YIV7_9BACT|nr:hypothetical protein [Enhygromyxa salina]PRQ05043.1 hypothetical protein ENSA7_48260 [Enhygromyxa salina]